MAVFEIAVHQLDTIISMIDLGADNSSIFFWRRFIFTWEKINKKTQLVKLLQKAE